MTKLTEHQKIMRVAYRHTGTTLTQQEVFELSIDDGISAVAVNDCIDQGRCEICFKLAKCSCPGRD